MAVSEFLVSRRAEIRTWILDLAVLFAALGCAQKPVAPMLGTLRVGEVARVGAQTLPASLVAEVARAQRVNIHSGLDELIDDTLIAEAARSRGLSEQPEVRFACETALARTVALRIGDDAAALGPPTDAELRTLEIVHVLVPRAGAWASERAKIGLAEAIRQSVQGSSSPDEFTKRAEAVPHAGMMIRIEWVPPFAADGKAEDGSEIDPTFVAAAFALASPQSISPVVETPFGWHVLRIASSTPPDPHQLDARRHELADAVVSLRARWRLATVLRDRRQRTEVVVAPEAEAWTALAVAK